MRIAIDANPIFHRRGGIGWYAFHLVKNLAEIDQQNEYLLYTATSPSVADRDVFSGYKNLKIVKVGKYVIGLRVLYDRIDVYHGTNFKLHAKGKAGGVVTIHDLALDKFPQFGKKIMGQRISFYKTRSMVRRATRVIAVSHNTAKDIQEYYDIPSGKIAVIYNGVTNDFYLSKNVQLLKEIRNKYGIKRDGFLLAVGGSDPRKNLVSLIKAYHLVDNIRSSHNLVLTGGMDKWASVIYHAIDTLGLKNDIVITGYVPVEDLRVLYSWTALFVYPSLYEGFGFPPLEAMACGAPVITSNRASLPEVVGDAAIMIDPLNIEKLAAMIRMVLADERKQQEMRTKGFERVKCFSWEETARKTLKVYREIVEEAH